MSLLRQRGDNSHCKLHSRQIPSLGKVIEYRVDQPSGRMVHFTEKVVRIVGKVQLPTGTANRQGGTLVSAGWYS